jgi:hypothetical protein
MRLATLTVLLLMTGLSDALADPEFHAYETRGPLIKEGQGGERVTIDGIDIWNHGDPPRRYQILGAITDKRCNCNPLFTKRISALNNDIAKATKAAGGDASILVDASNVVSQVHSRSYDDGQVQTFADEDHLSRYLVVKYLPDVPADGPKPPQ